MYPISAFFVLNSTGEPCSDGSLLLARMLSEGEVRRKAFSKTAFSAAAYTSDAREIEVHDDGGNQIKRYSGFTLQDNNEMEKNAFAVFSVSGFQCGIACGLDLLIPEHSRALSVSGINLLCCFPSIDIYESRLLMDFARVRAAENQIFTALLSPFEHEVLCWGPSGAPISLTHEHGESFFTLFREDIARTRKELPLRSLRKKQLRYALMHL